MQETGISVDQLVSSAGLDKKTVKAIVNGNYTPSPSQRQRLAAALGASTDDISWDHAVAVQHLRGNGPQCGRPTWSAILARLTRRPSGIVPTVK